MIMEYLTGITFGHVTLACLTLTIVALVLAGAEKLGVVLVKLMLNADHPDAPKFDWKLKVWGMVCKLPLGSVRSRAHQEVSGGSWYVRHVDDWHVSTEGDDTWKNYKYDYCQHKTKEAAEKAYTKYTGKEPTYYSWDLGVPVFILLIDLSIYLLQIAFIPTLTLLGVGTLVWGTRKIAGMVYSNSKNIKGHEERITKLEE